LALAASNLTFYEALGRIPLGVAAALEFAGPLAIAAAGIRRARDVAWPLLAAAGVALLVRSERPPRPGRLRPRSGGCAFWAAYILPSMRLFHEVGPVMTIGAASAVSALARHADRGPGSWPDPALERDTALLVAILPAAVPYLPELVALRMVPGRRRADGTGDPRAAPPPRRTAAIPGVRTADPAEVADPMAEFWGQPTPRMVTSQTPVDLRPVGPGARFVIMIGFGDAASGAAVV